MRLIDLYGTAKIVNQFMKESDPDPHFKFVIRGRTKGTQEDGHKFAIPCVKITQGHSFETGGLVGTTADSEGRIGTDEQEAFQAKFAEGQTV